MSSPDSSSELLPTDSSSRVRRGELVAAPRDYFLGPVFAATKQTGPREVTISSRRYLIGGFHPMRRNYSPPALDVRHARAIFCLLSFRDPFSGSRLIRFSFNEFCRRYAHSNGGRYSRAIAESVADLLDAYIRVTDLKSNIAHEYRLIEHIDIEKRLIRRKDAHLANSHQLEMWFNGCTLSPEFFDMLNQIVELQHLKLNVFTAIRSPLAQAVYLYIPSRAHHHTENAPFEINLTKLLEQVSFPVPFHKSKRKELFTKHQEEGRAILQQLDGLETLSGVFRVTLAETGDRRDWKMQAWVEKGSRQTLPGTSDKPASNSKIVKAYLKSGRTRDQLKQTLTQIQPLSDYERELLERAETKIAGNERFFEMARAILKPARFEGLLAEAKGDSLEGRSAKKNPTARLIYRIMEAIAQPQ
jgi:hypothetical protein